MSFAEHVAAMAATPTPAPATPLERITTDGLHFLHELTATLTTWKDNFIRNSTGSFTNTSAKQWIRLIMVVCTYMLLRPYLLKLGAYVQESQLKKEAAAAQKETEWKAKMDANDLRGGGGKVGKVHVPGVESDSEDEGEVAAQPKQQWGKKARLRQRKIVKHAVKVHEQNLADKGNESDKDIEDLLEE